MLWEKMQKKYELLEQDIMNHESVSVNSLGIHITKSVSSCGDGLVLQSTHTKLPNADGSWEDRKKYRKSKDLVQHWVNTSGHGLVHVSSDQFFPVPTEQMEMSLSVASTEPVSCDGLSEATSCCQEYQNNCELHSTSRLREFKNVDSTPGYSADHTHDEIDHMALMTQEWPPMHTRSITNSPKGCSKIPDSEPETLVMGKENLRTRSDPLSCNKTRISKKKILKPVSKNTSSPKEISLRSCDQRGALINGQIATGKEVSIPRIETVLRNRNDSQTEGNLPVIKGIPSCGKETLTHNDMTGWIIQKLLFDTENSTKNSSPNQSLLKEKPVSGFGLEKDIDNSDTDPTLRREMFLNKTAAPASGMESGVGRCDRGWNKSPCSDSDSSVSGTRRNAHSYSDSPTAGKADVMSCVCYTTASGTETNLENFYTISSVKKERALISRTEVNLRAYTGDPTVRKKIILAVDEQDLLPTTEEILKDVECISLSLKDEVPSEDGESLEFVKGVRNDKKKQCAAAGCVVNKEVIDPLDRRKCHIENPASKIQHTCEENVISRRVNLQNSKSPESCVQIKGKENVTSASVTPPNLDEDCVEQSLEDASAVIIYPLLSCKYENEVTKIRQKLNKMCENVKDKERGPLLNHDTGRAGHNYNCCPERRVFQHKRKSRRCRWSCSVIQDHLGNVETLSQSGSNQSSGCLGLHDKSVFPAALKGKNTSELLVDKQDKTHDAENGDRTKDASNCTPSHSEKQDIINKSCGKICSLGSQSISSSNKNSKISPEHFGMPQQFGRNKVTHSHCNFDADGHGFEMNREVKKEMAFPSVKSGDENNEEITDDDDDDIFYYRPSQWSSLHYEKENKGTNKTFCLNSQSRSVRNANDNVVSGPSVMCEQCRSMQIVFSNASSHSAAQTPHDGANMTKENVLMTGTKRTKSLNHSTGSGCAESEEYETGDKENSTKRNAMTQKEIKMEISHNFPGSHCAKNDGGNPEKLNALTRYRSTTATSNHVGSGHGENEDVTADDGSSRIFSESYDDSLEKEYIIPMGKCGRKSSNYLRGSGHDGKMPNRTIVITSRKRHANSLNSSVESKQDDTECNISHDGIHIKRENVSHRRKGTNSSSHLITSDHGKNENQMTYDGKCPDSENHLTRSRRGIEVHINSVRSKNAENEDDITDNRRDPHNRNVLNIRERGTATSYNLTDSECNTNKDIIDKSDANTDNTFGNRNSTFLNSNSSNTHAGVTSSHSQMLLTRSNTCREPHQCSVKPVSFEHQDTLNNVSSSDETSTGIEDLFTDSYRQKISRDVMKQFPSSDKSDDRLQRLKTEPKLVKKRRAETREGLQTGTELENEKEVAYDILYTPAKHLLFYEEKKEGILGGSSLEM
ncbi:hypothetical protein Cfor_06469 [Coptotermes formosanus]|uniref:Uncharacterized protein n=1 Tax=Coptotermes formosanus TaxID=36987 RepID=A0A6L2Q2R9_COPFO|nr:hypothetical protein Cfor_06469 [Coptotermes formosanus]